VWWPRGRLALPRSAGAGARLDRDSRVLIAVAFLTYAVVFGCARFAFSVLLVPMRAEFDVTRPAIALLATFNLLGYIAGSAIAVLASGRARQAAVVGMWVTVAGLLLLAAAPSLPVAALLMGLMGCSSAAAFISVTGIVSTRFASARGRSVGWAMAGIGGGIVIASAVTAAVLAVSASAWRSAWLLIGLFGAVVAVLLQRALSPSSLRLGEAGEVPLPAADDCRRAAAGSRRMAIFPLYVCWGLGYVVHATFLPELLVEERGVDPRTASLVFALSGVSMAAASPLVGRLSDRFGRRTMFQVSLGTGITAITLVLLLDGLVVYVLASLLFGVTVAGVGTLTPTFVADAWQPADVGRIFGSLTFLFGFAQAAGPSVAAFSVARTGSLGSAYSASIASLGLALVCASLLRSRQTTEPASFRRPATHRPAGPPEESA
jgi:predicted MFS family arabinose efflux permease